VIRRQSAREPRWARRRRIAELATGHGGQADRLAAVASGVHEHAEVLMRAVQPDSRCGAIGKYLDLAGCRRILDQDRVPAVQGAPLTLDGQQPLGAGCYWVGR
jgi:hypothetical protein